MQLSSSECLQTMSVNITVYAGTQTSDVNGHTMDNPVYDIAHVHVEEADYADGEERDLDNPVYGVPDYSPADDVITDSDHYVVCDGTHRQSP